MNLISAIVIMVSSLNFAQFSLPYKRISKAKSVHTYIYESQNFITNYTICYHLRYSSGTRRYACI